MDRLPSELVFRLAVYGVGFAIAGGGALIRIFKTRGHKSWPMTRGTVEQHFVVQEGDHELCTVAYSYSVNGEYYSGQITTSDFDGYPIGEHVDVYYKSDDPSVSVGKKSAALGAWN